MITWEAILLPIAQVLGLVLIGYLLRTDKTPVNRAKRESSRRASGRIQP